MSLNDFIILEKLGSGSFASVYKARRLVDQQIYALKKIDLKALGPKQKNNALNEIRLLACLSSPYIIGYCDSFFDEKLDVLTIAMEYANEGDLHIKIEKQKKQRSLMPEVEVWKIFIHLLYGLNELHTKNILHRDLKAENIFIGNGVYKIGDMNVSKIIKNGLACTQTGTPYYASPQVWNDQPYNDKSDIWSLGCILYEVATLRPPYEASSMEKLFDLVTKAPTPKIPTNYSREMQLIIDSCLQKNPLNRPSIKEILSIQTLKIYENLLIEFKPQVKNDFKQPLLKTIYMPSSKRQLKHQLPQSNYKSSHSKNAEKEQDLQKVETNQKPKQLKSPLAINQNIPKLIDSQKKLDSRRNRSRIMSCQLFKDPSAKKLSSKQNLMARADFIIESQRKSNHEKHKENKQNSVVPKVVEKKKSQKKIDEISKQTPQKYPNRQIYIEEQQIAVPKRLIFDQAVSEEKNQSQPNLNDKKPTETENEIQIMKTSFLDSKNSHLDDKQQHLSPSSPLKNISLISEKNHEHYKFETGNQPSINQTVKNQNSKRHSQADHPDLQCLSALDKPVSILIDVHQNQQILKNSKQINPQNQMSVLLGIEKIKNISQTINLKNKLNAFSSIKSQFNRLKMISKESQLQLQFYHQSHKQILQTLEPSSKTNTENTPSKTFQKKSRSKSIRKTQKFKPINTQSNKNTQTTLIDKINQKISLELSLKNKSKQKSAKKQTTNKKIFDKENHQSKPKQMTLIPKNIQTSNNKPLSHQKPKTSHSQAATEQKARHQPLREIQLSNIVPPKSQKKLSYPGINLFEQKKRKIFENPVHDVNDRLDKINLDNKIKKYINV